MNIKQQEWIGKNFEVVASAHKRLVGTQGIVVDETLNMIHVETENGVKIIPKNSITFTIQNKTINGCEVLNAPHERIKVN